MVATWQCATGGFEFCTTRRTAHAEEKTMNKIELQTILGYLNLGLAIAHSTGVTVGHFGGTDFIQLAQNVNSLLLNAVTPAAAPGPVATS
jgi:hypothetical protein